MTKLFKLTAVIVCLQSTVAAAAVFEVDLSPAAGALNLGFTTYTTDHAVGMAAVNETAQPASGATGNEAGSGISYDDVTNVLSFDIAYGSAFGFVDLGSNFVDVHFHAPGAVNFPAINTSTGIIHFLGGFHTPSGTLSGRITGSVVLTAGQETDLFDNEIYINVHSVTNGAGEIRGQLIPVPAPSCTASDGDNLTLKDDTVLNTQVFEVCDTIQVGPNYQVSGPYGNLTLRAGNAVVFRDGASVGVDGQLTVEIDGSLMP